jgi:hypothetical protein
MVDYRQVDKLITSLEKRCTKLEKQVRKKGWLEMSTEVLKLQNEMLSLYHDGLSLDQENLCNASKAITAYCDAAVLNVANVVSKYSDERAPESVSGQELDEMMDDSQRTVEGQEVKMLQLMEPLYENLQRRVRMQGIFDKYHNLFKPGS